MLGVEADASSLSSVAAACIRILFPFLPETGCAYLQSMLEIAGGMRTANPNVKRVLCAR
ncbi:MAG: hypothetical protein ACLVB5_04720 [Christensenellales bacterium]